jgi:seryl-tRNA synthetase
MIPIQFIRANAEKVKQNIINRRFNPEKANVDKLLQLDEQKNKLQLEIDNLRERRNEIADLLKKDRNQELIEEGRSLKEQVFQLEEEMKKIAVGWQEIMDWIPNMVLDSTPIGKNEDENVEVKAWEPAKGYVKSEKNMQNDMPKVGTNADKEFTPRPHWEVAKELDILDLETGSKVAGSRFYYLKKEGYLIMYGIFDLLMRKIVKDGFMPMEIPLLVKADALYGSSQFPADGDQVYKIETEYIEDASQLYLMGSSEPALFAYFGDKVIEEKDLPIKMMALTPCFRSEAGSWGKDVRGMKRAHQFMKLEMDTIIQADLEKAIEMHEYLLSINEWLLQMLEIPYHVINMCTGDLGYAAAAKKYDVEVWLPSSSSWMETMSDSITTDFQSRRFNIKTKGKDNEKAFAYTLNDTGATHRLLIAILEHYQQSDGSLKIPKVLQDYVGKEIVQKNIN